MITTLLSVVVALCSSPLTWFVKNCLISRDVTVALSFLLEDIDILVNPSNTVEDNFAPDPFSCWKPNNLFCCIPLLEGPCKPFSCQDMLFLNDFSLIFKYLLLFSIILEYLRHWTQNQYSQFRKKKNLAKKLKSWNRKIKTTKKPENKNWENKNPQKFMTNKLKHYKFQTKQACEVPHYQKP